MKLKTIGISALLFAGSLQASIINNLSAGFNFNPGPNSIIQNFSSPNSVTGDQIAIAAANNTTGSLFTGLTLEANTSLYYDPNGAGSSCNQGGNQTGTGSLPTLVNCVGNFATNTTGWSGSSPHFQAQAQSANASTPSFLPDLSINFNTPVYDASFLFAAPSAGSGSTTYEIQLFNASNQQVDTTYFFKGTLGATPYIQITESTVFSEILITQLANTGTMGNGATGYGNTGSTFNALIGNVEASTVAPEPGTIGLLGLGLAGLGYFARRYKKA